MIPSVLTLLDFAASEADAPEAPARDDSPYFLATVGRLMS